MLGLTTTDLCQALGIATFGGKDVAVERVVMDSRAVMPGDLFVALVGARTDGHQYLQEAQAKGAVAALVLPDCGDRPEGLCCLVVPDTIQALGTLARFHLARLHAEVLGITGSVGKTTAKDFLFQLLGGAPARVFAAPASYNSEVGLPLAILAAPLQTKYLILEYGINAPGEMDVLLGIARPDHVWITALGASHLEGLGTEAQVAEEKAKLAQSVDASGHVWMSPEVAFKLKALQLSWQARQHVYAPLSEKDLQIVSTTPGQWCFAHPHWGALTMGLHAQHEIACAFMAAKIAAFFGATEGGLHQRLSHLVPPPGRMSIIKSEDVTYLDDAYNANPMSMKAALKVLADWPQAKRRIAVLGSMKELGVASKSLHHHLGAVVASYEFDLLVGVGGGGAWIVEGSRNLIPTRVVENAMDAVVVLKSSLQAGDVVLLKASRAEALERILVELSPLGLPEEVMP